jgi:hypothetical protein
MFHQNQLWTSNENIQKHTTIKTDAESNLSIVCKLVLSRFFADTVLCIPIL